MLGPRTIQPRYHVPDKAQLKERAGFLVSRSLTLPALHPERQALLDDFPRAPKKNMGCMVALREDFRKFLEKGESHADEVAGGS